MFKYLKGYDKLKFYRQPDIFSNDREKRGHNMRKRRQLTSNIKRHNFLTNKVANDWNKLDQEAIDAISVNQFKKKIDKIFKKL